MEINIYKELKKEFHNVNIKLDNITCIMARMTQKLSEVNDLYQLNNNQQNNE